VTAGSDQQIVRNIAFAPFGGRTSAEFPPYDSGTGLNTVVSTRAYNLRGQVSAVQVTSPAGSVINRSFDYAYTTGGVGPNDPGPNLDRVTDHRDANESRFYFYDALDRFWKETTLAGSALRTDTYDANGNRTLEAVPWLYGTTLVSTAYESGTDRASHTTYNSGFGGATVTYYKHDAYGNRIWMGPYVYASMPSITYDDLNRLVEFRISVNQMNQPVLGQYTYDIFGRRVSKLASGATTLYFYDVNGHLIEERLLSTSPATQRNYVWLEGEPVGLVISGPQPAKFSWIHTDHLNNPIAVTSSPTSGSAQTVWRASFQPFGQASVNQDPDGDSQAFSLDLRLPGQIRDAETGLHYNWYRYYDPSLGRYISADPIGQIGGINVYKYALNSPINFTDALGLRIDWGNYVISNPAVKSNLERLNQALIDARGCDDFVLKVTGGDRYIDADGNVRSSTDNSIIPGSDASKTPHNVAKGGRAVDFTHEGVTDAEVDRALQEGTDFNPGETAHEAEYPNAPHTHVGLPNLKKYGGQY